MKNSGYSRLTLSSKIIYICWQSPQMGNYGFLCCTAMDYVGSHCTFVEVRRAYLHVDLSKAGSQLLQFPKQSREITCCLGRAVSKTSVSCSKQFPLRTKYHTCFVSCLISGEFINQQCTGRCGFGVPPPPPRTCK